MHYFTEEKKKNECIGIEQTRQMKQETAPEGNMP